MNARNQAVPHDDLRVQKGGGVMAKQGEHGISWTDMTWNPTRGCSRVSEGCRNCYAEAIAARFSTHSYQGIDIPGGVFAGFAVMTNSGPRWTGKVELIEERLADPLHWRKPRRVFVNSMSDLWHERLRREQQAHVYAVMAYCARHIFQVLTKRPEIRRRAFAECFQGNVWFALQRIIQFHGEPPQGRLMRWPLPNVIEGVSVENQETADARLPFVCELGDAGWRTMVSLEPMLGAVRLPERFLKLRERTWLIAGGESGPHARPSHPQWFRDVRDQCKAAGVAFHFKQWGEWTPLPAFRYSPRIGSGNREYNAALRQYAKQHGATVLSDGNGNDFPALLDGDVPLGRVGKKAAGRLLDTVLHDEFPAVRNA